MLLASLIKSNISISTLSDGVGVGDIVALGVGDGLIVGVGVAVGLGVGGNVGFGVGIGASVGLGVGVSTGSLVGVGVGKLVSGLAISTSSPVLQETTKSKNKTQIHSFSIN
ncbi:MAG TPA: hypothetical protein VH878_02185 [Thermodesulfobacteriota bacterium]|jgi:hypothetical protein